MTEREQENQPAAPAPDAPTDDELDVEGPNESGQPSGAPGLGGGEGEAGGGEGQGGGSPSDPDDST